MKKKIMLPTILALSVLVVGVLATGVDAQNASNYPPIVQKIADKFNLNVSEVEQVFDQERDEHRAEKFALFADRLDDLVSEGKLTDIQKEAILDKHEEMQDSIEELRGLSGSEKKEEMRKLHDNFRTWLEGESIDLTLFGGFGKGFDRGFGLENGHMMGR